VERLVDCHCELVLDSLTDGKLVKFMKNSEMWSNFEAAVVYRYYVFYKVSSSFTLSRVKIQKLLHLHQCMMCVKQYADN